MRTGHHALAVDAAGRSLPDKVWGWEMPVLADFSPCTYALEDKPHPGCLTRRSVPVWDDSIDTLAQARAWAAKVMAADSRVAAVEIRESVQEYDGTPWKEGKSVETIKREQVATCQLCAYLLHGGSVTSYPSCTDNAACADDPSYSNCHCQTIKRPGCGDHD